MNRADALVQAKTSKPGLRGRVDAKCIECVYDDIGGNGSWRQQVEDCTAKSCPLYDVRPKTTKKGE